MFIDLSLSDLYLVTIVFFSAAGSKDVDGSEEEEEGEEGNVEGGQPTESTNDDSRDSE